MLQRAVTSRSTSDSKRHEFYESTLDTWCIAAAVVVVQSLLFQQFMTKRSCEHTAHDAKLASYRVIYHILPQPKYAWWQIINLVLPDAPALTAAILSIVRGDLVILAHVHAHVEEVLETVLLRNPLCGFALGWNGDSQLVFTL